MSNFELSATHPKHYPLHNLSEFSLIGPSNSGKSTLINALAGRNIALTSKKPGKTKTLNFYDFKNFYLVDMPGYGFAQTSKSSKRIFSQIIDTYFSDRDCILGVCHLCSIHGLSQQDLEALKYLSARFDNYLLLVNKIDKISKLQRIKLKNSILKDTKLPEEKVLLISGKKNININLLKTKLSSWI